MRRQFRGVGDCPGSTGHSRRIIRRLNWRFYRLFARRSGVVITNTHHGGTMQQQLQSRFDRRSTMSVKLLAGYLGLDSIEWLLETARTRPDIAIEVVCGMGLKEGLSLDQYTRLLKLDDVLKKRHLGTQQGVYAFASGPEASRRRGLHGKAYLIERSDCKELFIGSSNFSDSGLGSVGSLGRFDGNVEVNTLILDPVEVSQYEAFYDELHGNHVRFGHSKTNKENRDKWMAVPISEIDEFPIRGRARKRRQRVRQTPEFRKGSVPTGFKGYPYVDIDLLRNIEGQPGSNLNVCFGKGRWQRASGKVTPRDWYEVEIMPGAAVTRQAPYPHGKSEFDVETHDGFRFRAKVSGGDDGRKNFRSQGDLKILGYWIKGLLEDAGALSDNPQEPVTRETLSIYGNSTLRLYRVSEHKVILNFPSDPANL